jgi:hypothetical protein
MSEWFGPNGGLPRPPKRMPPRAAEALGHYDAYRATSWPVPPTADQIWHRLALDYLIQLMTPRELAAYYAGVQQRLKAG